LGVRLGCLVLIAVVSFDVVAGVAVTLTIAFIVVRIFFIFVSWDRSAVVLSVIVFIISTVFIIFAVTFDADDFFFRICWWCFSVVFFGGYEL
jgi:hypothetical protein